MLGYLHRLSDDEDAAVNAWSTALTHAGSDATVKGSNHRTRAWMANIQACLGDTSSALDAVDELLADDRENGYLRYRLGHVLAEAGRLDEAVQMLDSAVDRGFLSAQLWQQEEIFALSRVRERNDYAVVTQRLAGNVDRCRITYAADLQVTANNNHRALEIRSSRMTLASSDQGWIAGIAGEGIVTVGDPRLKAPTKTVEDANDVKELLTAMVDRLRSLNGAGLAAPQVGVSAKMIVVEVRKTDVFPDRPESPLLQMINPVVTAGSEETEEDWEGCFSVPGLMGQVRRSRTITVNFVDEHGQDVREEYSG
jgi:peptide deformylase